MLMPYPISIPPEAYDELIELVKGNVRTARVLRTGWNVVGFVAGKLYPDDELPLVAVLSSDAVSSLSKDELCERLEQMKAGMVSTASVDWRAFLRALISLLLPLI